MSVEYVLKEAVRSGDGPTIDYAKELNSEQLEAVTAPPGPMLVIAGAGSGKTRTLTYRVAWLVEHGVAPESILLLTFTNKASKEMLARVGSLLPHDLSRLWGDFSSCGKPNLATSCRSVGLSERLYHFGPRGCGRSNFGQSRRGGSGSKGQEVSEGSSLGRDL